MGFLQASLAADLIVITLSGVPSHNVLAFGLHAENVSKMLFDRRLGGSESVRTEHPNREVVSSRPCVRARSVIHVESGIKWGSGPVPFSCLGSGHLISLFPSGLFNLGKAEQL